jgi:hypothetical protein
MEEETETLNRRLIASGLKSTVKSWDLSLKPKQGI